jgi:alanine racemase
MKNKTVAEINLDHLTDNVREIGKRVFPAKVIAVVKADAYGHGAVAVAKHLADHGIGFFAVAQFKEAMELRESGVVQPILIFERLFPDEIPQAVKAGYRISVFGREDIEWIDAAAQENPAFVHVNVDTGMGRIGLLAEREPDFFNALINSRYCRWEGLYSHFSTSDEADKTYAYLQIERFREILARIDILDRQPSVIHMANSGAVLDLPEAYFDAVRPGILMYGHRPSPETSRAIVPKQVMTLKTTVAHIRDISAGSPISYGRRWTAKRNTKIAVLPIGYADGIRRALTNKGEVLIQGKTYPMVGTVTMDHVMIDVGDDPIHTGDDVIVWGESSQGTIQVADVAEKAGTIPYEITCGVSQRVRRVYVGG